MSLDTILASGEMLEVVVEIDSAHRVTGTLVTWYYSAFFRETDSTDTPANTTMPKYLVSVGPLAQGLGEDILFSGLSTNEPGNVVIFQPLPDVDKLSQLNNYTFIGYQCRVKLGLASSTTYSTGFYRYRTTTIASEPDVLLATVNGVGGIQATFKLQSVLGRMLEETLIVNRHVGIPTCARFSTATASAIVPRIAAYDLIRFTGMIRFRCTAAPSATITLHSKVVSSTNNNWQLVLSTSGTVQLFGSGGGVADLQIISGNMCDGTWKTVVFARDTNLTAYLMINNVVIGTDTALSGSPNAAVASLIFNFRSSGTQAIDIQDGRLYDKYIPPDEMRGISSVRSDGDDLSCIGLWRFDDNTGNKANDYSVNNNDTNAFGGTVNVDYSWQESDLGEPELAGRPFPITQGEVINAPAQMIRGVITGVGDRYRFSDGPTLGIAAGLVNFTLKSQGTVLTPAVNYTAPTSTSDSVTPMLTGEAEPITFDHLSTGTSPEDHIYPSALSRNLLTSRTRITTSDISNHNPMTLIAPWECGFFTDQDTKANVALQDILGNSGMCYFEEPLGSLWIDMLLPATGYGPFNEPCLDLRGMLNAGVSFGDIGDISGSCTIAGWFKTRLQDQTSYNFGASEPNVGTSYIIAKPNLTGGQYAFYFQSTGTNAGRLAFRMAGTTTYAPAGLIEPNAWYFVAAVFDDAANTQKLYVAKYGGTLVEVASGANTGSPTVNTSSLNIGSNGYSWISTQHLQLWSVTKTLGQLQSLMAVSPVGNEANLVCYIPGNEGIDAPIEKVTGTVGSLIGPSGLPQWAPKFTVNLNDTPSVRLIEFHHLKPAYDVKVKHSRNRRPMSDSEIDSSIVGDDRIELKRESKEVPFNSPTIRDRFKDARPIVLDSCITDKESARRLLRVIVNRFSTDNYIGVAEFPSKLNISRQACGLRLLDEIGLTGTFPEQLVLTRSFRVVSVSHNPLSLSTTIGFTG